MNKPPLWSGGRFNILEDKLSQRPDVRNPAALAAWIGRKRYSAKIFNSQAQSARGKIFGNQGAK